MNGKKSQVLVGVFAAFGLVVFAGILSQLMSGLFIARNICENTISKKTPSPDGLLEISIEFKNCTESGAKTEVLLYQRSDPSTAAVLVSIEENHGSTQSYPAAILTTWLGEKALEISLPSEHIPYHEKSESYGVSINYTALGES